MPRISAASNAAQRAETQQRILTAFGELLFTHGLPGLTMTDVARHARIGRTAVYNYYADIEELLIAYALDETERFLVDLRESLDSLENPVERLALYVRAQVADLPVGNGPALTGLAGTIDLRIGSSFARTTSGTSGLTMYPATPIARIAQREPALHERALPRGLGRGSGGARSPVGSWPLRR